MGAGIISKLIGDFHTGTSNSWGFSHPYFAANSQDSTQVRFHSGIIIPEPEEYALVFGLFALGFVFFRHRRCLPTKQTTLSPNHNNFIVKGANRDRSLLILFVAGAR